MKERKRGIDVAVEFSICFWPSDILRETFDMIALLTRTEIQCSARDLRSNYKLVFLVL